MIETVPERIDTTKAELIWETLTEKERQGMWWYSAMNHKSPFPREPEKELPKYIYFIASSGLIKIGSADNINRRFGSIQTMSPVTLTLLGYIPETTAREYELHRRFAHLRQHGEWFTDCDELRTYIAEVLR